jgi:RNA polymerase sigma-70 factor (ECF subfamily)
VLRAGHGDSAESAAALETLCRAYWLPLYAFVRRKGFEPADAEDYTQAFFQRLLERNDLAHVSQDKGRFRSFLMAALQHFISDELDRARALKRGGGRQHLRLDTTDAEPLYAAEMVDGETPERAFDRNWTRALLARAGTRLRNECAAAGKEELFAAVGPETGGEESQAAIAARLGLTESAVKSAAFRLRQRYRELIIDEVAQTVSNPAELEEELRQLLAASGR